MMFSGTFVENLIATVERVEQAAHSDETTICRLALAEDLLASVEENANYDSNFLVA